MDQRPSKPAFTFEEAQSMMQTTQDPTIWALCNTIVSMHTANGLLTKLLADADLEILNALRALGIDPSKEQEK